MNNEVVKLTKNRLGFEKLNIALGILYKEWYELISNQLSKLEGINLELGCGASFIDKIIKSVKKSENKLGNPRKIMNILRQLLNK